MSVKKLKIEYGDSVFSLPREKLMAVLSSASEFHLKVLLLAASDDALRLDFDKASEELCRRLDCTETALGRALDFWRSAGIMSTVDASGTGSGAEISSVNTASSKKTLQSSSLPVYTESRAADVMEQHMELAGIIDACQQIAEKIFTPNEVQSVVAIYDYLGLDDEGYIVTLYQFCKRNGKTSPRYIEKVALSLYDAGVTTTSALNDYIKRREHSEELTAKVRSLIGAHERKLTSKETKCIECWASEWSFDFDVINRAYEITVDRIGEYKMPYMNRVLENWYNAGLTTLDAVEESLENYKKSKTEADSGSDFETNEYFEAALARSQRYLEESRQND